MNDPSNAESRPRPGRQALIWTIKIVVSGGLLYVLLSRVDLQRLWQTARGASLLLLAGALLLYFAMILLSAWRWGLLLDAQHVRVRFVTLMRSFLVATFFNNFLPSNIGGDVIRIRDTARAAGSKTLATTVVLRRSRHRTARAGIRRRRRHDNGRAHERSARARRTWHAVDCAGWRAARRHAGGPAAASRWPAAAPAARAAPAVGRGAHRAADGRAGAIPRCPGARW